MATSISLQVAARVRPVRAEQSRVSVDSDARKVLLRLAEQGELLEFGFDSVFGEASTQEQVFESCVRPIVEAATRGVSGCIFAYGATGAGKSYTMHGTAEQPGIIPRAAMQLFEAISPDSTVTMSALEIYNNQLYDLLGPKKRVPLKMMESFDGVHVCDLTEHIVQNYGKFKARYEAALAHRSLSATQLNAESSRSHFVICIKLVERIPGKALQRSTQVNLIDLAGNEDNRKTGNTGERMTESSNINLSLFALVKVIDAIRTGQSRIPYRESKLTRLLQNSLGGNCRTAMVCCINPRSDMVWETQYTLTYAAKARGIEATVHAANFVTDNSRDSSDSHSSAGGSAPVPGRSYMTSTCSSKARVPRESTVLRPVSHKRARGVEAAGTKDQDNVRALELLKQARKAEAVGAITEAIRYYKSARRYLTGNEKLESKIRKLEAQVELQSQAASSEQDMMMKRLQESEVSEADMIHYILTSSAKKPRKAPVYEDDSPADNCDEPPVDDGENVNPNTYAKEPLTPSKAELKRTLNSRIMHALNVQLMDILNEGTKQEVKKLYGIGPKRADKIIEAREGVTYNTVDDLQKAGISTKVARTMRQAFMAQLEEA